MSRLLADTCHGDRGWGRARHGGGRTGGVAARGCRAAWRTRTPSPWLPKQPPAVGRVAAPRPACNCAPGTTARWAFCHMSLLRPHSHPRRLVLLPPCDLRHVGSAGCPQPSLGPEQGWWPPSPHLCPRPRRSSPRARVSGTSPCAGLDRHQRVRADRGRGARGHVPSQLPPASASHHFYLVLLLNGGGMMCSSWEAETLSLPMVGGSPDGPPPAPSASARRRARTPAASGRSRSRVRGGGSPSCSRRSSRGPAGW